MSLVYGASGPETRPHVYVCKIGGSWLATFRGALADRLAREIGRSITIELPYAPTVPGGQVTAILQRQNPGVVIVVDDPVLV